MKVPMLLLPLLAAAALVSPVVAACQKQCGDVDMPYPFGIGPGCYLDTGNRQRSFELVCNKTTDGAPRLTTVGGGFEVLRINELQGKMVVRSPVIRGRGCTGSNLPTVLTYDSSVFRVSGADNRLVVVGCNASAYVNMWDSDYNNSYWAGCQAVCLNGGTLPAVGAGSSSCNGTDGCCQAPIPSRILYFDMSFLNDDGNMSSEVSTNKSSSSTCSGVMLVEKAFPSLPTIQELLGAGAGDKQVSAVLDWTAGNESCREAERNKAAYACASENSECRDSENGTGYLCRCAEGYQGNPYLRGRGGCQDINECKEKGDKYPCSRLAFCRNKPGSHKCHDLKWVAVIGGGIAVVVLVVGMSCSYTIREKWRLDAIKKRHFKQHGGFLLFEELKSRHQGGHLSFTVFTKEELDEATNRFDERHVLGKGGNGTVYRGDLRDGRAVAIKRCKAVAGGDAGRQRREFGKEALILSQVNHRNIVKLYGCCLEVEVPMLVYQFIPNGTLYQLIHGDSGAPSFAVRLKIAHEAAEALAYLHSTASPPIIHRDVKSANILLDECYAAKVSDFGASSAALAPATDEAHLVSLVQGTCGYLDPEYMQTCRLTDRSDVYSFGVVLLELLTSRKALSLAAPEEERSLAAHFLAAERSGRLDELVDPRIKGEVGGEVLETFAALAKRCLEISSEKRPSMREVAEELDRVRKLWRRAPGCLGEIAHTSIVVSDR